MTDEEREKKWKDLQKMIDDQIAAQAKAAMMYGTFSQSGWSGSIATSPTLSESRGMYPYQEPEQDEQGTYYGYKILVFCTCGCGDIISPRYPAHWKNGELQADREPNERTQMGIHFTKRPDNPCLQDYLGVDPFGIFFGKGQSLLVHCALSGTIVETEQGFRAEHAQIIEVYDGNWQSYQDHQRRTTTNSHRNPWEEDYWKACYDPRTTFTWDTSTTPKKGKGGKLLP